MGVLNWLQATGCRLQATGYKLQATGYRLQAAGYKLQVIGHRCKLQSLHSVFRIWEISILFSGAYVLDGVGDALMLNSNREVLQGRPKAHSGGKSATMMYSYKYTFCNRAIVATLDLSAQNLNACFKPSLGEL